MDMMDHRSRSFGGLGGRIILLGDGTELTSSEADSDMFDHDDEDLEHDHQQVHKGIAGESDDDEEDADDEIRKQREGTPAPTGAPSEKVTEKPTTESPSSVTTEKSEVPEKEEKAAAVSAPSSQSASGIKNQVLELTAKKE